MNPLVSIHIITYNQEAFVGDAIESALAQRYDRFEVVVADDGSRDKTPEIVRSYAAKYPNKVKALTGGPNLGLTGNSNRALAACTGEFIARLDGDDLFLPDKLAAQIDWFRADPRRVLCGCDWWDFDSTTGQDTVKHDGVLRRRPGGTGPEDFIVRGCPYAVPAVMVRSSAIPAYGFDARLAVVSDWKLWIDVLAGGGIWGHVDGLYARYRRHPGNVTQTQERRVWVDLFMTLGIIEAENPALTAACRRGRARLYHRQGVTELRAGHPAEARRNLEIAFTTAPSYSWRVPAWWAMSFVPERLRRRGST